MRKLREKIKLWISEQDISYFSILSVCVIPLIAGISFIFVGMLLILQMIDESLHIFDIYVSYRPGIMIASFWGIWFLFLFIALVQGRYLLSYEEDKRRNDFLEEDVILNSSEPKAKKMCLLFLPNIAGLFFWKDAGTFHRCRFRGYRNGVKGYFEYFFMKDKMHFFTSLYSADISYWDIGIWVKSVTLDKELPIHIVYGKKSRYLKYIAPVEGYAYTEEQLVAIEKWNQSYPYFNSTADRLKGKMIQHNLTPFCVVPLMLFLLAIVPHFIFWSCLGFCELICQNPSELKYIFYFCAFLFMIFLAKPNYGRKPKHSKWMWQKNPIVTVRAVFKESYTVNDFSVAFSLLYKEEKALTQILTFETDNLTKEDEVIYHISREHLAALRDLYDLNAWYWGYLIFSEFRIEFKEGIPLLVTFDRKHRLLHIDPVDDYSYTGKQLSAIERFNRAEPTFGRNSKDYKNFLRI